MDKILETQRTCKELYDTHDWLIAIDETWILISYDKFMEMFTDFYAAIFEGDVHFEAELDGVVFRAVESVDRCKGE